MRAREKAPFAVLTVVVLKNHFLFLFNCLRAGPVSVVLVWFFICARSAFVVCFFLLSSGRSSQVGGFGVATVDGWADPVVVFQFVGFALAPFQRKLRLPDDLQNRKDNEKMRK